MTETPEKSLDFRTRVKAKTGFLTQNAGIHWALPVAALIGLLCQFAIVPSRGAYRQALSGSVVLSLAAAAIGAFLAFLFGVPRYLSTPEKGEVKDPAVRFNNNFQEVSDWLTKIIIGVGLIQLRPIIANLETMVTWIGDNFHIPAGYVGCIAALYLVCGFMIGYVWTVQHYARKEMEYLERQYRIANRNGGYRG